ncbi:MAG: YfhO family protein [Candidatus Omnitrophota bacterium]
MKITRTLLAFLLLSGLVFFYFTDIILSDKVLSFRDLSRYYYPLRQFAFTEIKKGNFPFWNPYISSGHPLFAALQSAVLYPPSLVYLIFDFDFAFNFFIILHIFLGGFFFYILMRSLKFNQTSALISAITFMFGGYLIAVINLTTTLAAAVWFPLAFLFYHRSLTNNKLIDIVLSAVFLGMMFLGGEPTPMFATVISLGVYSLFFIERKKGSMLRIWGVFISTILLFALLFSFQILPFIELIKLSTRQQSAFDLSTHWSLPPRDIVNFLLPFFYGPLHFQEEAPFRQDWLLLSYLSVAAFILFLIAVIFCRNKNSNFFKVIFILGLIFTFGKFTPVYALLYKVIPGFGLIRYPIKFFFLSAVSFAFLTGAGWQEYCRMVREGDEKFIKFIKSIFLATFIASILFLLLYIFKEQIHAYFFKLFENIKFKDRSYNLKYFTIFGVDLFNFRRMLVFFILAGLFLFLGAKKKLPLSALGLILLSLIFVDLYGVKNLEINPAVPAKIIHKETPNIAYLKEDKSLFRIYASYQMHKSHELLKGGTYEEAFVNSIDGLSANRLIEHGISDTRGYLSIHNLNYSKVLNLADTAPLPSSTNILNMLNVKYILTPREIKDPGCELIRSAEGSFLYKNRNALPRALLASSFVILKDEMDIAAKLKSKSFNPDKEVILEEEPVLRSGEYYLAFPDKTKRESCRIIHYEPNEVIIEADCLHIPRLLVFADNYYPGWEAFVDGRRQKIYRANFILRAVYLNPGKHLVVFRYNPASFKIGLLISLSTLLIVILVVLKLKMR